MAQDMLRKRDMNIFGHEETMSDLIVIVNAHK